MDDCNWAFPSTGNQKRTYSLLRNNHKTAAPAKLTPKHIPTTKPAGFRRPTISAKLQRPEAKINWIGQTVRSQRNADESPWCLSRYATNSEGHHNNVSSTVTRTPVNTKLMLYRLMLLLRNLSDRFLPGAVFSNLRFLLMPTG